MIPPIRDWEQPQPGLVQKNPWLHLINGVGWQPDIGAHNFTTESFSWLQKMCRPRPNKAYR
ncbi:hypothetical protein AA106555_0392 [Neokomagataea thailandica NBRC 106555]|uniref:Transposase n=1 Tax=Neokomagataea thailandica NBRC 106555 TaxID=1223520 RepID=A0ABQ0QN33_9PROT|nr:hypothetical protein AA106555_0392 [Neokomagataea thailandica NBRC 106555]